MPTEYVNETAESSDGPAGAALLEPDTAPPQRRQMPGWAVLLHNDDVNEFAFVTRSVVEFARLPVSDAVARTIEAHESGVALLVVTHAPEVARQFTRRLRLEDFNRAAAHA
jgi:ATP-dependent Clp protease adapter protein ClpS